MGKATISMVQEIQATIKTGRMFSSGMKMVIIISVSNYAMMATTKSLTLKLAMLSTCIQVVTIMWQEIEMYNFMKKQMH